MTDTTNPRKVYETGGSWVLALPKQWARDHDIGPGDRFVFEAEDNGFRATAVRFTTNTDD